MQRTRDSMSARCAVIVGCGQLGSHLATCLDEAGCSVHLVDRNGASFRRLPEHFDTSCFEGDPIDPAVLRSAGLDEADLLITASRVDDLNAAVALVGRRVFGARHVFARIDDPNRAEAYRHLGIHTLCATSMVVAAFLARIDAAAAS